MSLKKRLAEALEVKNSKETLVDIILDLKKKGWSQKKAYELFNEFLKDIIDKGTEEQEDYIRDVMDLIVGWCNPSARLFDDYLPT